MSAVEPAAPAALVRNTHPHTFKEEKGMHRHRFSLLKAIQSKLSG